MDLENISLKVFPEPTEEDIELYIDKHKHTAELGIYIGAAVICLALLIFALTAFFMVKNYSITNIGMIIVLTALTSFFTFKFINEFKPKIEAVTAKIIDVKDITATYESINPQLKGEKVKLEIFYQFTDNEKQRQSEFTVLIDRNKYEQVKPEIPDPGNEISLIYNKKKSKVISIFLPALRQYIEQF